MNKQFIITVLVSLFSVNAAAVTVHLDVSETPELAEWGKQAKELVEQWYQRTVNLMPTEGFLAPSEIKLKIKKADGGVAWTVGPNITVASSWAEKHPEDIGCVYHEMVHVIQSYKGYTSAKAPGWLVEGIADYMRWAIYEGKPQKWFPPVNKPQGYKTGYQVTGGFLLWLESGQCPGIVKKLNTAIRKGTYEDELFEKEAGKPLDALWVDYLKARKTPPKDNKKKV